jgi:hypothetical protein
MLLLHGEKESIFAEVDNVVGERNSALFRTFGVILALTEIGKLFGIDFSYVKVTNQIKSISSELDNADKRTYTSSKEK